MKLKKTVVSSAFSKALSEAPVWRESLAPAPNISELRSSYATLRTEENDDNALDGRFRMHRLAVAQREGLLRKIELGLAEHILLNGLGLLLQGNPAERPDRTRRESFIRSVAQAILWREG